MAVERLMECWLVKLFGWIDQVEDGSGDAIGCRDRKFLSCFFFFLFLLYPGGWKMCNLLSEVVVIYEEWWGDRGGRNKGDHSSVSDEMREKTWRGRENLKEKEREPVRERLRDRERERETVSCREINRESCERKWDNKR